MTPPAIPSGPAPTGGGGAPKGGPGAAPPPPRLIDVQGLWRRQWLRTAGEEDATTEVWWIQAGPLHVDLRLPADLPRRETGRPGVRGLADLPAADLRRLARAEGFAGITTVERGVCTWTRRVNWRGPLDGPDVGALFFEGDALIERGVFADYAELWRREAPGARPPLRAMQLRRADGQAAVLAQAGEIFMLGRGAPGALAANAPLADRLDRALDQRHRGALRRLFDQEFCIGRITPAGGVIARSTNPLRVGARAFDADVFEADAVRLTAMDFEGAAREDVWLRVPVAEPCP
ncbi:hypothetical protein SAMN05444336_102349 [Albimonas donghaensis]|uniref:Uncharacterized protein n=1 Tax=Albimonas donghaensis TaxID=356660 RepID=A0A1H2WE18_9RHOB|nr:hypothetical protein [Albimonas donghaensis]SDW78785.1 hypothetical protein SAMN05444336_102349 [Albimonas donghaensis]